MAEVSQNRTMTTKQLRNAIKYCVAMKRPVFIWGPPGSGKSDTVAQLCADMGGILYDLRLSMMEQTDIKGIPFYNRDSGKMEWAPPVDLPDEETAQKYPIVFLFLDEMNSAPPSTQGACYQLILNRRIGMYKLPDNVVVIAAGNRDSDRGISYKMPTPLANRFVHFELRVDYDSWEEWALQNKIHKDVVGFLGFSKNSLNDFDPKSPNKSFATPRTWEFVSQLISDDCDDATSTDIIAGTIGEGLALKFMAHRKSAGKLPKPEDILSGKVTELNTKDISAMYSLGVSLSYEMDALWKKKGKTKQEFEWHESADRVLKYMMDCFTPEILVVCMRTMLKQYDLPFSPSKLSHFKEFNSRFGKLILKASSV
jgi:hypothetical protein